MVIIIDSDKCNGVAACPEGGLCIDICALNAMDIVEDWPVVNEEVCPGCGLCVLNCPNEAISKT